MDQDVGLFQQRMQRRDARFRLQVQRDRLLAAIELHEIQRVTAAEGPAHLPRIVAALTAKLPDIEVHLRERSSSEQVEALLHE